MRRRRAHHRVRRGPRRQNVRRAGEDLAEGGVEVDSPAASAWAPPSWACRVPGLAEVVVARRPVAFFSTILSRQHRLAARPGRGSMTPTGHPSTAPSPACCELIDMGVKLTSRTRWSRSSSPPPAALTWC